MGTPITDFRPMLAKAEVVEAIDKGHFAGGDWMMEPKHDGMRAIVEIDSDLPEGIRVSSRSGLGYTGHLLPSHIELLRLTFPDKSIIDGELAAIKRIVSVDGVDVPVVDFNRTMRVMGSNAPKAVAHQYSGGPLSFLVFDVVKWRGEDVTGWAQRDRRTLIDTKIRVLEFTNAVFVNPQFYVSRETYEEFLSHKIEGAIIKNSLARYVPGKRPSKTWIKLKAERTFDVVVMGFTEGRGKYEGQIGAIEFGAYDSEGELKYVGRCSGMDDAERKIWSNARDIWDEDEHTGNYVIEVKANEMVGSGEYRTPRHPQYVCYRTDKLPTECTMEQFKEDDR